MLLWQARRALRYETEPEKPSSERHSWPIGILLVCKIARHTDCQRSDVVAGRRLSCSAFLGGLPRQISGVYAKLHHVQSEEPRGNAGIQRQLQLPVVHASILL